MSDDLQPGIPLHRIKADHEPEVILFKSDDPIPHTFTLPWDRWVEQGSPETVYMCNVPFGTEERG